MMKTQRRRGYILLFTLFLLALVATTLTVLSIRSLNHALTAAEAVDELQRRWGTLSCRAVLLPHVESILSQQEHLQATPLSRVRSTLRLGNHDFQLIFGDETAKANVNFLYRRDGLAGAERAIRRLVAGTEVRVELSPSISLNEINEGAFLSLGQIFVEAPPRALIERLDHNAAADLTSWGEEKVNFLRASRLVLVEVLAPEMSELEVERLMESRNHRPVPTLGEALNQLGFDREKRQVVTRRLVEKSACHSLWIICANDRRSWYELAVHAEIEQTQRTWTFQW
jgi:hypothetical protein